MLYKLKSKKHFIFMVIIGVIFFVFGVFYYRILPEEAHNLSMLSGMFSGFGGAFIAMGVINLIRLRLISPEKLKIEENERNDERNIQLLRISYTMAEVSSIFLFAIMAFIFIWLDYKIPAFISMGALFINAAVMLISYHVYSKRM